MNHEKYQIPSLHLPVLTQLVEQSGMPLNAKIVQQSDLVNLRDQYQKPIGFLTGCFDIFHPGHEIQLRQARGYVPNGILVVGLNSDDSVKRLKGESRPINNQNFRSRLIAALPYIDHVFIFDEPTAVPSLELLKPDVFITYTEKLSDKPEILYLLESLPTCVFRLNTDFAIDSNGQRVSTTSIIQAAQASSNSQL